MMTIPPLRITRFRISDSIFEFFLSNLSIRSFSRHDWMHLDHRRWNIESSCSFAKFPCCLNAPHGVSWLPVLRELCCRFLLLNITAAIVFRDVIVVEPKNVIGRKYNHTRAFSSAVADVRAFMLTDKVYALDQVIRKLTRPVRDTHARRTL